MITEGWMNHKGGRFTADISEIDMHQKSTGKGVRCPGCKEPLKLADFKVRRDEENDISTWTMKHDCGADLTIFNESAKPTFKQFLLAEAKAKKKTSLEFPSFEGWLLQNQVADEDELYDAIDNAYNQDTYLSSLATAVKEAIGKKHIKDAQPQALKVIKSVAAFCITGSDRSVNVRLNNAVPTFAEEALEQLTKEWDVLTESGPAKGDDMVKPHKYTAKILHKGKDKKWPALKGEIYEKDVLIGRFSRKAVEDGYVPPIEYKFLSSQAKARFDDFADSLSIEETIEALLP